MKTTTVEDIKPIDIRYDDETVWLLVNFSQRETLPVNPIVAAKELIRELARHGLHIAKHDNALNKAKAET